jgi:hypothetical protein
VIDLGVVAPLTPAVLETTGADHMKRPFTGVFRRSQQPLEDLRPAATGAAESEAACVAVNFELPAKANTAPAHSPHRKEGSRANIRTSLLMSNRSTQSEAPVFLERRPRSALTARNTDPWQGSSHPSSGLHFGMPARRYPAAVPRATASSYHPGT